MPFRAQSHYIRGLPDQRWLWRLVAGTGGAGRVRSGGATSEESLNLIDAVVSLWSSELVALDRGAVASADRGVIRMTGDASTLVLQLLDGMTATVGYASSGVGRGRRLDPCRGAGDTSMSTLDTRVADCSAWTW